MLALSSLVEPLRMANQLTRQPLYDWVTLTRDGEPAVASNGLSLEATASIEDAGRFDIMLVCGGLDVRLAGDARIVAWLQRLASRHVILGGVCTGAHLLARAGLLDGYRATIHWQNIAALREEFPAVRSTPELFVMDRERYTCSGGIAPLDMMLTLISQQHGIELAASISEEFIHDRIRTTDECQREPLKLHVGLAQPKLIEAVRLMEANVEEPIPVSELASYVGVSRRQLERLFQKYLNTVPTRYYLQLRLTRARQFLRESAMTITQIALACGFSSTPHFSKCYRDTFGCVPSAERRPRAGTPQGPLYLPGTLRQRDTTRAADALAVRQPIAGAGEAGSPVMAPDE